MPVFIFSALALGLLSSLHCLGMCGPLVIGIIPQNSSSFNKAAVLILYHSGRLLVYGLLGVLAGLIGQKLFLPNLQQTISIGLGIVLLLWVILKYLKIRSIGQLNFINNLLNKLMSKFLNITGDYKYLLLGGLNGLLPCGMVYIAMTGAFTLDSISGSFLFMIFFGAGTIPLLVLTSGIGLFFKSKARRFIVQIQPVFLAVFALLLIVRGLNLGIPYLSPEVAKTEGKIEMECCKEK